MSGFLRNQLRRLAEMAHWLKRQSYKLVTVEKPPFSVLLSASTVAFNSSTWRQPYGHVVLVNQIYAGRLAVTCGGDGVFDSWNSCWIR